MEPYLHLHYPASDIPAQARRLYATNSLRLIRDVEYRPSPIVPAENPLTGRPLDLGNAALRSVSPIHLEYLRNMGVRGTLTISLLFDDRLFGMVACHHRTPRRVSHQRRSIYDLLSRVISLQIELHTRNEQAEQRLHALQAAARTVAAMASAGVPRPLLDNVSTLFRLVDATGVAVIDGEMVTEGGVPELAQIARIAEWLRTSMRGAIFAADCLSEHLPWTAPLANVASGLLAVALATSLLGVWRTGGATLPAPAEAPWLALVGLCGLSAHYCLNKGLSLADALVVLPMEFLRLPVIALAGLVLYGERLDPWVLAGGGIVAAGVWLNLRGEVRRPPG